MESATAKLLRDLADRYETTAFLKDDPSRIMHSVTGRLNREAAAFVASSLSFGSRSQFLPKIESILSLAHNNVDQWIRSRQALKDFSPDDRSNFYRFFTRADMHNFFRMYSDILTNYGSLGEYIAPRCNGDAFVAVKLICDAFRGCGIIPKDSSSCCKRVCMFLRWMVRTDSPVDLGLWSRFIDRRTLIIPMDVHVQKEASKLGLMQIKSTSMSAARRLTSIVAEVFPDDPLKADFALFGLGITR